MIRQLLTLATLIVFCASSYAEIYRWTDEDGNTHFSDSRPEHLPQLQKMELYVNTAIPAEKPAPKPQAEEGPDVIIIGNSSKPRRNCSTKSNGILENNQVWDTHQDRIWKGCAGMR